MFFIFQLKIINLQTVRIMVLDFPHQKRFGFYFSSWRSQFREVVGALVKGSRSFGQRQQKLWSKAAGALVKGSRSFGQKPQQELWSKAAGAFIKSSRSFCQRQQELLLKATRAMALEEGTVKIEKFDSSDFGFWKMQIEDYLYQKKLYLPLTGQKPTDMV